MRRHTRHKTKSDAIKEVSEPSGSGLRVQGYAEEVLKLAKKHFHDAIGGIAVFAILLDGTGSVVTGLPKANLPMLARMLKAFLADLKEKHGVGEEEPPR